MSEPQERFDAVKLMRELRDQLGREMSDMTFEEQKAFIRERLRKRRPSEDRKDVPGQKAG